MKKEYPICPRCFNKSVAGADMVPTGKRSLYCTSAFCNYDISFKELTTPVPFKHISSVVKKLVKLFLK